MTGRLRLLSCGAGVDTTAVLVLIAQGKLSPIDGAIFSDTGWEPAEVYAHLERIEAELLEPMGVPLYRVSGGEIRRDALDPAHRYASMPLFVKRPDGTAGMGRRQCTHEYKLKPIKRQVRDLLGCPHPKPIPRGTHVEMLVGISRSEVGRVKDSGVGYIRNVHPLLEELDQPMTRRDCQRLLAATGWGATRKSACIGCPFHSNAQWRRLRDEHPDEWADAVSFDHAIRHTRPGVEQYLHVSLQPLDQAPIDKVSRVEKRAAQLSLIDLLGDLEAGVDLEDVTGFEQGCGPWTCRSDGA